MGGSFGNRVCLAIVLNSLFKHHFSFLNFLKEFLISKFSSFISLQICNFLAVYYFLALIISIIMYPALSLVPIALVIIIHK
jgi:hypothetical protein